MENSQKEIQMREIVCLVCSEVLSELAECRICDKCFTYQGLPYKRRFSETQIDVNELLQQFEGEKQVEENTKFDIQYQQFFEENSPKRKRCESQRTSSSQIQSSNSCFYCNRKTGIYGFECNHCLTKFCKTHRLPQQHDCDADFKSLGYKKLKMQNPSIRPLKIIKF